ncbi:MAG: transketolase [Atopobiaceae bacterium]|nr:transketolase [Atopobiaceae bacterium]
MPLSPSKLAQLEAKAREVRRGAVTMTNRAQTGHIGGALSETDYLVALYYHLLNMKPDNPRWQARDRFVLSKGHCVEPLYWILADLGFFPREEILQFSKPGSHLIGHTNREVPGIEMNTGALGHGLSGACGMALAAKLAGEPWRTFCLVGDGELAEGSIWEAAMFASHHHLDNLFVAIDRNGLQITGPTEEVMAQEPLAERWRAFGFDVDEVDGNDIEAVIAALEASFERQGKPHLLILHTVKGKGVSFMENQTSWHHGRITAEELERALADLADPADPADEEVAS